MKRLIKLSAMAFFIALSLFASCSDDPQPNDISNTDKYVVNGKIVPGNINLQLLSRYSEGLTDATYTLCSTGHYYKDESTDDNWEKYGDGVDGLESFSPAIIVIQNGNCWTTMKWLYSASGPTMFSIALELIDLGKHEDYYVLISKKLQIDDADKTLSIGKGKFGLLCADDNHLVLSKESKTLHYEDGNLLEGKSLQIGSFKLSAPFETPTDRITKIFDTEEDAYDWIIALFREYFGESVDRNQFYGGRVIYTDPMFGVEDLIRERERLPEILRY